VKKQILGDALLYCKASSAVALRSKRLTQGDKELCGLESGNGIQVVAYVNPHGADGRLVAQAQTNRVAVIAEEVAESDILIYIAAVIKNHRSQAFFDGQRKAPLGVENEELEPSGRNRDLRRAGRGIVDLGAEGGPRLAALRHSAESPAGSVSGVKP